MCMFVCVCVCVCVCVVPDNKGNEFYEYKSHAHIQKTEGQKDLFWNVERRTPITGPL